MGVQQQLSLEDPHSSLNWSPPSKQKEEHLPTMRRKQLPWNQHYPGHPPTATILSLYSFAQSPCVKLSLFIQSLNILNPQYSINSMFSFIFIQWIPGQSTIPSSDLANKAAKEAITIHCHRHNATCFFI